MEVAVIGRFISENALFSRKQTLFWNWRESFMKWIVKRLLSPQILGIPWLNEKIVCSRGGES